MKEETHEKLEDMNRVAWLHWNRQLAKLSFTWKFCLQNSTKDIYAFTIYPGHIDALYFSAEIKENLKLKEINLFYGFFISQHRSLNSDNLYSRVSRLIYLKHNIECLRKSLFVQCAEHK